LIAPGRIVPRLGSFALCALQTLGKLRHVASAEERAQLLSDGCSRVLRGHAIDVQVQGQWPDRPALLVCNHVSYLDPVAVMAARPSLPMAKVEVRGWPLIGGLLSALGVRFVRRDSAVSGAGAIRWMARTLEEGASVLTFPEGTTTDGSAVLPFRPGAFVAARHAGVLVVPVAISYGSSELSWTGDQSFVPHYLKLASRERTAVCVAAGEPLRPSRYTTDLELARRAQAAVSELLSGRSAWHNNERSSTSRAA
jgi:1-acyl-sn-glycerol-3-phosphate acyltransferase